MRLALLTLALLLAPATTAGAAVTGDGWATAASARFAVPLPSSAVVIAGDCPAYADGGSCGYSDGRIYLVQRDRFSLAHELEHLLDAERYDGRDRVLLTRALRIRAGTPWGERTGLSCMAEVCPSEVAADAYAACALRLRPDGGRWTSSYGYDPTPRQHRRVCAAIRAAARS